MLEVIDNCLVPKLEKNYDESDQHAEYSIRNKKLKDNIYLLTKRIEDIDRKEQLSSVMLSSLLILYKELQTKGPWNREESVDYSIIIDSHIQLLCDVTLDNVLKEHTFNSQEIFEGCMRILHQKLTPTEYKKHPSLIEVYCLLLHNVKNYKIVVNPLTTFPMCLLLMDDYVTVNKAKGLKCCNALLTCLKIKTFDGGNYYEVILRSLKKNMIDKDIEVTTLVLDGFLQLVKILPLDVKTRKIDETLSCILEQIHVETNLRRKVICFNYLTTIMHIHETNCMSKMMLKVVLWDNMELCTAEPIAQVLLDEVLMCTEAWLKYCWAVWRLESDHKFLSLLFKLLYTCKEDELVAKIQKLLVGLLCLCKKSDDNIIGDSLEKLLQINNTEFQKRLDDVRTDINIHKEYLIVN